MKLILEFSRYYFIAVGSIIQRISIHNSDEPPEVVAITCKECQPGSHVTTISIDKDGSYLVAGFSCKTICSWDLNTLTLIGTAVCRKRPVSIVVASLNSASLDKSILPGQATHLERRVLLIADRAGDLYAADFPHFKKQVLVTGHTATVITDMDIGYASLQTAPTSLSSPAATLVATSDRDEKIRISRFPDLENIQTFCLGHKSVVTSVSFLSILCSDTVSSNSADLDSTNTACAYTTRVRLLLVTTGWDHTLLLWDAASGALLDKALLATPDGDVTDNRNSTAHPASSSGNIESSSRSSDICDAMIENIKDAGQEAGEEATDNGKALEEEMEKQYNEGNAGKYPTKVVAYSGEIASMDKGDNIFVVNGIIAVIFKDTPHVQLYSVRHSGALLLPPPPPQSGTASDPTATGTTGTCGTTTNDTSNMLQELATLPLLAAPLDIAFHVAAAEGTAAAAGTNDVDGLGLNSGREQKLQLVALLPKPFGLQIFDIGSVANHVGERTTAAAATTTAASTTTTAAAMGIKDITAEPHQQAIIQSFVRSCDTLGVDICFPDGVGGASHSDDVAGMKKHSLDKRFNSAVDIDMKKSHGAKRSKKRK